MKAENIKFKAKRYEGQRRTTVSLSATLQANMTQTFGSMILIGCLR